MSSLANNSSGWPTALLFVVVVFVVVVINFCGCALVAFEGFVLVSGPVRKKGSLVSFIFLSLESLPYYSCRVCSRTSPTEEPSSLLLLHFLMDGIFWWLFLVVVVVIFCSPDNFSFVVDSLNLLHFSIYVLVVFFFFVCEISLACFALDVTGVVL